MTDRAAQPIAHTAQGQLEETVRAEMLFATAFTVKRPTMRHPPCTVLCRCDGDQVYTLIGPDPVVGVIGFGDTLAESLRNLADALEEELTPNG